MHRLGVDLSGKLLALDHLPKTLWCNSSRSFEIPFRTLEAWSAVDLKRHALLVGGHCRDACFNLRPQIAAANEPGAQYTRGVLGPLCIEDTARPDATELLLYAAWNSSAFENEVHPGTGVDSQSDI